MSLVCLLSLLYHVCPMSIVLQHQPASTKPATCMSTEHSVTAYPSVSTKPATCMSTEHSVTTERSVSTKPATCMSTECSLLQFSPLCPLNLLHVCPLSILLQHEPSVSTKPATYMSTECSLVQISLQCPLSLLPYSRVIRRMRLYLHRKRICAYKRAAPNKEQCLNSSTCQVHAYSARPMQTTPYIITI